MTMTTQTVHKNADATNLIGTHRSAGHTPWIVYSVALQAVILLGSLMCTTPRANAQQSNTYNAGVSGPKTQILIPGSLATALDSKKRKSGDEVVVKITGGVHMTTGSDIPRGAKIIGHVTESTARSGGQTGSSLAIAFDKIAMPDGKSLPISGVIQAVAGNPSDSDSSGGGIGYAGLNQTMEHTTAGSTSSVAPVLNEQSVGVVGIKGLELGADGVLKSEGKAVKLGFGSQILIRAQLSPSN
jgi:hypothetical protein